MAGSSSTLANDQNDPARWRDWRFERIGWCVLAGVVALGLAGLFGDGALASASVRSSDGLVAAHYDRIVRHGAPSEIRLRFGAGTGRDTVMVVSLDETYLSEMEVARISPAPLRVRASSGRVEYHLLRLDAAQRMTVVLSTLPGAAGVRRALIGTSHGSLELRQLVLP